MPAYRIEAGAIEPEFVDYRDRAKTVWNELVDRGVEGDPDYLMGVIERMAEGSCLSFQGDGETVFVERLDSRATDPRSTLQDRCAARNHNWHVFITRVDEDRLARWAVFEGDADAGIGVRLKSFPYLADAQRFALDSYRTTPVYRRYEDGSLRRVDRVRS